MKFLGWSPTSFLENNFFEIFMFKNITKLFGRSQKDAANEDSKSNSEISQTILQKSKRFSEFLNSRAELLQEELSLIRYKCQDLRQTNFDLGMKHLKNNALPEAIFRFRLIKKFWPEYFEAYYQLAYCLTLHRKYKKACDVLEELLEKEPNFDPAAQELLSHLNQALANAKKS